MKVEFVVTRRIKRMETGIGGEKKAIERNSKEIFEDFENALQSYNELVGREESCRLEMRVINVHVNESLKGSGIFELNPLPF